MKRGRKRAAREWSLTLAPGSWQFSRLLLHAPVLSSIHLSLTCAALLFVDVI